MSHQRKIQVQACDFYFFDLSDFHAFDSMYSITIKSVSSIDLTYKSFGIDEKKWIKKIQQKSIDLGL